MRPFSTLSSAVLVVLALAPGAAAGAQATAPPQTEAGAGYYFLLGRHLETDGKIPEAIAAHKKAIELAPASAELQAELAGLYARQDRPREALDAAEAAITRDPSNREANRILGTLYAARSDDRQPLRPGDDLSQYRPRAIAALEKSRRDVGVDLNLEFMLGRLYLQSSAYDKAIASLRRVVDEQPGYPEAAMMLAAAHEGSGRQDEAIRTLEASLEANPTFFRGHVRLAEIYEQQGRFREAADRYAKAQAANARADLTTRRASALINAGRPADARDLLQAAVAKKPAPDAPVLYMLAQAQRRLKHVDEASATVARMKSAFPDDPRTQYVAAQLLDDQGRRPEAIAAFQGLIERSPDDASLVHEYAALLEKGGRLDDAERALRDLLSKDPLDANALNSLGYMLADHGRRLDEAVDLVQRALKVEPLNPSFLDSLGWAYFRLGKLELADPPLTQAAEKLPTSSAIQDHLGDLRYKQRRFADAAAAWERALAGDGESIDRARIETKVNDARARVSR